MGEAFFNGWALWQKLVFILGCGIALTICLGSIKLAHTHWRLHKYAAVADKERKEQAIHREMSQKRRGPGVPRADEVPFGIRALERGVEVEGVWHSRGNTPEPSIRNGSRASSIWDFMPKKTAVDDTERQVREEQYQEGLMASRHGRARSDPTINATRPTHSAHTRTASAEKSSANPDTSNGIPKTILEKPVRSKHPPPSFAKYSGNPSLHRQSSSVRTVEGIEALYRASTYLNPDVRHGGNSSESYTQSSSGSSNSDSGPISAAAPKLLNQKPTTRERHHSVDFELLDNHRQSQAAETGQLTPKARNSTNSVDIHSYVSSRFASSSAKDLGYFAAKPGPKASSTPPSPADNPSPPKVAALPAAIRRTSIPDVTSFAQFVQTLPAMPRPASMQLPPMEVQKTSSTNVLATPTSSPPVDTVTAKAPVEQVEAISCEQAVAGAYRPSFEKERRPSQVIRGHGSGFEILKPGTLPVVTPAASPPPEKQFAVPPISLQKYVRSGSRSSSRGSTGRKLQKKRPLSHDPDSMQGQGRRNSAQ